MKMPSTAAVFVAASLLAAGEDRPPGEIAPPVPHMAEPPPMPGPPPPWCGTTPTPPAGVWLGCMLNKPEPTAVAQIPSLPPGMGLVVRSIFPDSPAVAAKLEPMDVIWKLDDQMLVNQSQLATLLSLKRPGDEAKLAVFRAGKSIEVPVKLAAIPASMAGNLEDWHDRMQLPDSSERVIDRGERTATYKTEHGKAVVKRDGISYVVTIQDAGGKELLNQKFPADGKWEGIPDGWNRRVWVLRRSLDYALDNSLSPVRPPRPRVVPAPQNTSPATPPEAVMPTPSIVSPPGKNTSSGTSGH
jgi:hypothetical protein